MEWFPKILLSIEGIVILIALIAIVYFGIRRIRNYDKEDFEKRSN